MEEVLESLLVEGEGYPERQKELASVRYYLCDLLAEVRRKWCSQVNGVTNYAPLVGEILRFNRVDEPVGLVTFNYDLLLESALSTFGFEPKPPDKQFDSHPVLKLFKPHGSVGWARIVDVPSGTRMLPQQLIEVADTLKFRDEFVLASPTDLTHYTTTADPSSQPSRFLCGTRLIARLSVRAVN